MTIGELRDELEDWHESFEIIFGCEELEFYRLKKRGAGTVQLESNQTGYKDGKTGKLVSSEGDKTVIRGLQSVNVISLGSPSPSTELQPARRGSVGGKI